MIAAMQFFSSGAYPSDDAERCRVAIHQNRKLDKWFSFPMTSVTSVQPNCEAGSQQPSNVPSSLELPPKIELTQVIMTECFDPFRRAHAESMIEVL